MNFAEQMLGAGRPNAIRRVGLPRQGASFPSPADWRGEVLYFLLVDRFSDGLEHERQLPSQGVMGPLRPADWSWSRWAESGAERWQGGSLQGVLSKLSYLKDLGVSTIWLSPVFKQRGHLNTFHGYGIQDFLDVDPRLGTRQDLVDLVRAAHAMGIRILLDIIFNHSGENWVYPEDSPGGAHTPHYTKSRYPFGTWRGRRGEPIESIATPEDGVWPQELQAVGHYTRAGRGDLGAGDLDDPEAEHKRTDFITLRDLFVQDPRVLEDLARCYMYWIALTDCDGFRIDTLKHVSPEQGRNFCGSIKEFAASIGKQDFFLVGEVAGGDFAQDRYLEALERNLNAVLDIGEMRLTLRNVAKGLQHPAEYFGNFSASDRTMGSHRALGEKHVSILDDHDHVFGVKTRFGSEAVSPAQVAAAVGLQLLTLGIPCIYYGTEQGLGGPEASERKWLPDYGFSDRYLRETMFGASHPRRSGLEGLPDAGAAQVDLALPGFGPGGTTGFHVFDRESEIYRRIAAIVQTRSSLLTLSQGRQYLRQVSFFGFPFAVYGNGELIAFSRILAFNEVLVIFNPHGLEERGADVVVDASLNPEGSLFQVVCNTAQAVSESYHGSHPLGSSLGVERRRSGEHVVRLRSVGPSEIIVLAN